ncbi:MAG: SDR family oxidoreductase [Desulfobacter postgatei]|uniref:Nucleoside-diphosphate-sugar epimerase n=1 Tax=Desulfobacter postgatei 2ac9 TaxID=879212 RepID=I5B6J2_9BACT|nr:SDR family oxidoreductase [Desulfobacter postgatei]EIM65105.1 nucleoside-diphosphate-sugar epimerase [Desulfobacter postgatei 2ac9]MDD4274318.1 SDR family oxidoreductase [Desulfobacter postgatei]
MRILITGNMGYIGPILTATLRSSFPDAEIWGFDNGYFAHCLTNAAHFPECIIDHQIFGDMRQFPFEILKDVDAVVHLGAISNDPMGNKYEAVTNAINDQASRAIAREAKAQCVKTFVFASSCSMYGQTTGDARKETDTLNPLTAYARSKVAMEEELKGLSDSDFVVTSLRFATACGMSPRLRLDLVLNDFVAGAITSGEITVLSDGSPWRPLVHVKDMCRAIVWALNRESKGIGPFLAVNIGSDTWNYQVKELAYAVAESVSGTTVSINKNAQPDKRSYKVDFSLFRELAPDHQPQVTLEAAIAELKDGLEAMNFADPNFRQSNLMRLKMLETHIQNGSLNANLQWQI